MDKKKPRVWRIKQQKSYCGSASSVLSYLRYAKTSSLRLVTDFCRFLLAIIIEMSSNMSFVSKPRGFIALISSIIISLVLLTLVTTADLSGFHVRSDVLATEYQEVAISIARSCADVALLKLSEEYTYAGGESITIGTDAQGRTLSCDIGVIGCPIFTATSKTCTIETRGTYGDSYSRAKTSATVQNPAHSPCSIVDGDVVCEEHVPNIDVGNTNLEHVQ